jgi:hypothetical protein
MRDLASKIFLLSLIALLDSVNVLSQDGSNMKYVKVDSLHSYFDKTIQVDFFHLSHGTSIFDTVSISFKGTSVKFIEHRQDDGYNNWFFQQYLESLDSINGYRLRLVKSKLTSITRDEVGVINYFNFYNPGGKALLEFPIEDSSSYRKKSIAEILILLE